MHRKLSGAFLACMRIGARVPARTMLREMYEKYEFGEEEDAESDEEEEAAARTRRSDWFVNASHTIVVCFRFVFSSVARRRRSHPPVRDV